MSQDKFKNSGIFVSSNLQTELLTEYFNHFSDKQEPGSNKFKVQIKTFYKERCIEIIENEAYQLNWNKIMFRICYSFDNLITMTKEKPNYQVDIRLRNYLISMVENILGYAQAHHPMGCYIKVIFPDTGLCSLCVNNTSKLTYLEGKLAVALSLTDFDVPDHPLVRN